MPKTGCARCSTPPPALAIDRRAIRICSPSRSTTPPASCEPGRAGHPISLPERTKGTAALFVTPSPLGLRLVYVQPILDAAGNSRLGSVAVEHVITPGPATPEINPLTRNYTMPTTLGPVGLRLRFEGAGERTTPDAFTITAPDGAPLVEASVAPADLAASRQRWRRGLIAVVLAELGLTLLLTIGPLLDRRAIAASSLGELRFTLAIAAVIAASGGLGWLALRIAQGGALQWPLALLLSGAVVVGLVAIAVPGAVRLRIAIRANRRWASHDRAAFAFTQLAWGLVLGILLTAFERLLGTALEPADVDLRHFSLHPWSGPRLAVLFGILLWHAAVLWAGTLGCVMAAARWRTGRRLTTWNFVCRLFVGGSDRRARRVGRQPGIGDARLRHRPRGVSLRGCRADRPLAHGLVPADDGRVADARVVHGISAAGAADLSVGAFLRGAVDASSHRNPVRCRGDEASSGSQRPAPGRVA